MYAFINLPGSRHFRYFGPDTKQSCQEWLDETVNRMLETELLTSTLPRQILSNKLAESIRYLDGSHVVKHVDWTGP